MTTKGTKEWADSNINIQFGCPNGCKYCYAAQMAIRFKRFKDLEDWTLNWKINEKNLKKKFRKRKGRIMFPTSHDLTIDNYDETFTVLTRLCEAGNNILITTKPRLEVIKELCNDMIHYRDQIQFRFTIGSMKPGTLLQWEPYAPSFAERFEALKHAYGLGIKTSVSIEPYLDRNPALLIKEIEPYVSDSIWLGIMNKTTLPKEGRRLYKELNMQDRYQIANIKSFLDTCQKYAKGKLRLKDSIKNLLNMGI